MPQDPRWVRIGQVDLGEYELPGNDHNPVILQYFRDVGHGHIDNDETAWCAAFVGSCLERSGIRSTGSLLARSYLEWGIPTDTPKVGTVVILSRGNSTWQGHVGFFMRETANYVYLLGGNQANTVSVEAFPKVDVLGYRDPIVPGAVPAKKKSEAFNAALAAILLVEGGYSDHPNDPGGPTNRGILLTEFAAYKNIRLTSQNRNALIEQLKTISDSDLRAIYWKNYWVPASCDELPDGISLYVFDTAVLHGLSIGKKVLQQALGVDDDGIIGPITKEAARKADPIQIVYRMRDIRLERLRKSANWVHFGRGWTNRVNAILEDALKVIGYVVAPTPEEEMTETQPQPQEDGKHWSKSMTVWGTIITFLSTVAPVLAPIIGLDVTPGEVQAIGEQGVLAIQAIGGLIGSVMAIYGRLRAKQALSAKPMTVRL